MNSVPARPLQRGARRKLRNGVEARFPCTKPCSWGVPPPPSLRPLRSSGAQQGPTVSVTGGQVAGAELPGGGAVFKGIPYAESPVGDLRWREPGSVVPWAGVRQATAFGPVCIQRPGNIPDADKISSEDCLTLNVWTPSWPAARRYPVMVWIHGGGNRVGGSVRPETDGAHLSQRDVVVVTFNYRLGTLGFFAHPSLSRESPDKTSGNQGLLD
jgi:para-nitrobenzyl esterase